MMQNFTKNDVIAVSNCPENGQCTIEILKNKNLALEEDSIGKLYPKVTDGENIVVKYTFKKENKGNYADGNTSETIHFEITKEAIAELKDKELQKVKLLYGKHFFNRSLAGYYKVVQGSFKPSNKNIDIDFVVPLIGDLQQVKHITIKL